MMFNSPEPLTETCESFGSGPMKLKASCSALVAIHIKAKYLPEACAAFDRSTSLCEEAARIVPLTWCWKTTR